MEILFVLLALIPDFLTTILTAFTSLFGGLMGGGV